MEIEKKDKDKKIDNIKKTMSDSEFELYKYLIIEKWNFDQHIENIVKEEVLNNKQTNGK